MRNRIFLALIIVAVFTGCSKEEEAPAPAASNSSSSTGGGSGGGSGFNLANVTEFSIDDVNLTSFDFHLVTESDLEFYTDIWDGNSWVYLGSSTSTDCVFEQTTASDLPLDLICALSAPDILNAQFYNSVEIEIWDEDQTTADDDFGSVSFIPANHITTDSGTKTITLSNTAGIGYTVEVVISW